jgi:hypothetical protein
MAEEQISVVLKANIDNYNKNMSIAAGVLKDLQKQSTEFMKINNGVEDSFTKIDFAAKKFGETAGVLEKKLVVVKKAMTDLVVAGQENTRAFRDLDNQYRIITNRIENKAMAEGQAYAKANMTNNLLPKTKKGLDAASVSLKKNNMQWTSLALVLQDLPYGFRGIQNNLPALFGSLATGTGAIYAAFSGLIALITAWDMGLFGTKKTVDAFTESLKKTNEEVKTAVSYNDSNIQRLTALVAIGNDYTKSENTRLAAFKEIKEELGKVNKEEADKLKGMGDATQAVYTYIEAIRAQQLAEVTGKKMAELQLQIIEDRNKISSSTGKGIHVLDYLGLTDSDVQQAQNRVIQAEGLLRRLEELNVSATIASLNNPYSKSGNQKTTTTKTPKDNYLLDSLKSQQQAYKDDIYSFRAYGILIINEEERLAKERAILDGTYLKNKKDLHARYDADRLANDNLFEKNLNTILDENAKKRTEIEEKELKIQAQNRLDISHAILAINKKFAEDELNNAVLFAKNQTKVIETELGVQDKLNRNNLINRIQFTEQALAKLVALAAFTFDPEVLAIYLNAIDSINAKLKGMGETWDATGQTIKNVLENVMADSISKFAENIGKALGGEKVDLFGGIGEMIADGAIAIGKALIAYGVAIKAFKLAKMNPLLAVVAGAGLVIAGSFLKSKLGQSNKSNAASPTPFANGGIVSGPTMGLMGEYPGAKSNPEVVAPLDKLKNLIGGSGGGTLEARISGNDLLILMNKAQRNNNLSF